MKKTVLILGATSSIARAIAKELAARGYPLFLGGRNSSDLEKIALDLKIRYGVKVDFGFFDAEHIQDHANFLQKTIKLGNGIEGVVVAFGDLGNHEKAKEDFLEAEKIYQRNLIGACSILTYSANYLEKEKKGFIVVLSSVAGDRGRQSNYIYGSAKAGLTVFLQGLRNRLFPSGIKILTVKLGFVDTSMTFGLPGLFLKACPKSIGKSVVKALERSREEIYLPWFWWGMMGIIKSIPEKIFKRLKL